MRISRREFLGGLGAIGASVAASRLGMGNARAQSAGEDYRALVCVFLFGGNDGNNLVVPIDGRYAAYAAARGAASAGGLALAQETLLPLTPAAGGAAAYGLHPRVTGLKALWDAGALAPVFNVGTLLAPTTKSDFLANKVARPRLLLSHEDQQHQWASAISNDDSASGWGGRLGESLPRTDISPVISLAGNQLFCTGTATRALALPPSNGNFGLVGFDTSAAGQARRTAFDHLRMAEDLNLIGEATAAEMNTAIAVSGRLQPILAGTGSMVDTAFATQTSAIALQLRQVARLIQSRASLGVTRQIFFVSQGGYDTHNDELNRQDKLLGDLSPALKSFYDATVTLGIADKVTTFTLSDFARTLKPASGAGADHAWGNHHLVMGGAVKGHATYGTFPDHTLGGNDDFTREGRWVPTTSVDQYAATLATWFGASADSLKSILPNLSHFPTANLGFV